MKLFRRITSLIMAFVLVALSAPVQYITANAAGQTSSVPATCPLCNNAEITWTPLPESGELAAGHYALEADKEITAPYTIAKDAVVCVYLNGADLTSTDKVFEVATGTLNIMGEGVISGAGATDAATILVSGGKVNLAGATIKHAAATAYPSVVQKSGTVTIYDGAVLTADEGTTGTNLFIMSGTGKMYGGEISNGTGAKTSNTGCAWGGNVLIKSSNTAAAGFWMYGGEIFGGKAEHGGNIGLPGHFGGTGALTLRVYGGKIYNGEATHASGCGGNIYAFSKTHRVILRVEEAEGTPVEIYGGKAANGGNIAMNYQVVTDTDGKVTSTAPFFAVRGGDIYGGIATANGGNLYLMGPYSTNIGAMNDTAPTDPATYRPTTIDGGDAANGGNIYATCSTLNIKELCTVQNGTASELGDDIYLSDSTKYTCSGVVTGEVYPLTPAPEEPSEPSQPTEDELDNSPISNKFTEGTTVADCPHCMMTVLWIALPQITSTTALDSGHYYLAENLENTASYTLAAGKEILVHLNGKNLNSTSTVFTTAGSSAAGDSTLNLMGDGIVSTSGNNTVMLLKGNANLYGGTIKHTGTAASVALQRASSTLNLYNGVTFDLDDGVTGGSITILMGRLRIYGGTINKGIVKVEGTSVGSAVAQHHFNMYGGIIKDGISVGNLYPNGEFTISGDSVILPNNGGLKIAEGKLLTVGELGENAAIAVIAEGAFTTALSDPAAVMDRFTTTNPDKVICVIENSLAVVDGTVVPDPTEATEPSIEPTEPTEPGIEPTEPSIEPTEPSIEPTEPEATTTETLSFEDTQYRTVLTSTQQIWEQNGITVINEKSTSTSNVADYCNPARFYKNSKLTVKCTGMTAIMFNCDDFKDYATVLESSIPATAGVTVTKDGAVITVTFDSAVDSFTIDALSGGQVRMHSVTVYTAIDSAVNPNKVYETAKAMTFTADGETHKCPFCGEYATWNALPAANGESNVALADGHYYVAEDLTNAKVYVVSGKVCINLNGKTIAGQDSVLSTLAGSTATIMGDGQVYGNIAAASVEAAILNKGTMNLCGGTFGHPQGALKSCTLTQHGKLYVYDGTVFDNTDTGTVYHIRATAGHTEFLGGTFKGTGFVRIAGSATANFAGAPKIAKLQIASKAQNFAGLTEGAELNITIAPADGVFTTAMDNAEAMKGYFTTTVSTKEIGIVNNAIALVEKTVEPTEPTEPTEPSTEPTTEPTEPSQPTEPESADMNKVYEAANAMTFTADGETHKCPFCGEYATWNALPAANGTENVELAAGHYYAAESMTNTRPYSIAGNVCINLNSKNITSEGWVFITDAEDSLTVMGQGVVTGGNTTSGAVMPLAGTLNLCGGTFHRADTVNTHVFINTNTAAAKNAVINIYEGTVVEATGNVKDNLFRMMGEGSQLNICGGELKGAAVRATLNAQISISGSPVIEYLQVAGNNKLIVGELTEGAMITVDSAKDNIITDPLDNAVTLLQYFTTGISGKCIGIVNGALALVDTMDADLNGDGYVTDADAVYLLRYTLFPDDFPVPGNCDFDGDGHVTDRDAVYLLVHTLYPEVFPLPIRQNNS